MLNCSQPSGSKRTNTHQVKRRESSPLSFPRFAALLLCAAVTPGLHPAALAQAQPPLTATNAPTGASAASTLASAGTPLPDIPGLPQKPAWLTDLALGVKQGYDDNLFGVSGLGAPKKGSWVTTVSPVLGVDFAPLLEKGSFLKAAAFGYAPESAIYYNQTSENYTAHRLAQVLKGGSDTLSFALDNGFNYIDGGTLAPTYAPPDDARSAYATAMPRERRAQLQDRAKVSLKYEQPTWFLRPAASLLYYDLMTELKPTPGYQNYADRYDVNGGLDFGYKLNPQLAATLGYRYGHQYQQQFPTDIDPRHLSSPSDYQRVLLGLEGTPWKWLTLSMQAGPDFRAYEPDSPTHTTPVNDFHPIKYYGEASLVATLTAKDRLSFRYRQWQWVSSTGKLPLFDSLYELSYRRTLTKSLSLDLVGRIQSSDYTSGNAASSARDDWQYTVSPALTWALNRNLNLSLSYCVDLGRNAQDDIANAAFREFDHQVVFLGVQFKL